MESAVTEARDGAAVVKTKNGTRTQPCDNVIVSIGDKPNHSLADALKGKVPVFNIGDANQPNCFAEAIAAGYYTAAELI